MEYSTGTIFYFYLSLSLSLYLVFPDFWLITHKGPNLFKIFITLRPRQIDNELRLLLENKLF